MATVFIVGTLYLIRTSMTLIFYDTVEGVQSNQGDSWFEAASKTGALNPQPHMIWVYGEYGGVLTNRTVHIRVLVDGAEKGYDYHTPDNASEYRAFSVFGMIDPSVEGVHTISLEVRGGHSSQTVGVRRIRLAIMQE